LEAIIKAGSGKQKDSINKNATLTLGPGLPMAHGSDGEDAPGRNRGLLSCQWHQLIIVVVLDACYV